MSGTNLRGAILLDANLGKTMHEDNVKRIKVDPVFKYWPDSGGIGLEYLSILPSTSELMELNASFKRGANLNQANLSRADLSHVNLSNTDLSGAVLLEVDLSKANLRGATGITEDLLEKQAKSLKGATMINGSIHA